MSKFKELLNLYTAFFRIGILTFGGGYAMLPMLEKEVVEKHKWATMEELMDYFAISQCTPGVIAVNTATFVGTKKMGLIGAIVATLGVVTPSVIIITVIASVLSAIYENPVVKHAFAGIAVAVSAVLVQAVFKVCKSGIVDLFTAILAILAYVLAFVFDVPTIPIIVAAGAAALIFKAVLRKKNGERRPQ